MTEEKKFSISWALAIERELSHIISDTATYHLPSDVVARRVVKVRDDVRKALRSAGYKGVF